MTTLREKMAELVPDRRARIEAETERLYEEHLTLQELRKAKELTQVQLAEILNIRQATIAQMEKRSDLMLSTLRSYVEAMGGRLNLIVEFPDREPVSLAGFSDLAAAKPKQASQPGAARPA